MEETQHDHDHDREAARETIKAALSAVPDATFDILIKKPRRETEFFVHLQGDDNRAHPHRIKYRALSPKDFDDLVSAHPPTAKEERKGAQWNKDTFPAALISEVSLTPKLTVEQARDLMESPNWAAGESQALFINAVNVCQSGLDVPFNAGD